jgi:hypothetical protein
MTDYLTIRAGRGGHCEASPLAPGQQTRPPGKPVDEAQGRGEALGDQRFQVAVHGGEQFERLGERLDALIDGGFVVAGHRMPAQVSPLRLAQAAEPPYPVPRCPAAPPQRLKQNPQIIVASSRQSPVPKSNV